MSQSRCGWLAYAHNPPLTEWYEAPGTVIHAGWDCHVRRVRVGIGVPYFQALPPLSTGEWRRWPSVGASFMNKRKYPVRR